ncbi:VWA domain-containing protein [Streptomyces sp. NPDC094154]|uniref:VWA domain-containing protein n=1 Tax=unclassified Streptomyces TaxID=2593676 RepID=UPI0037F5AD88
MGILTLLRNAFGRPRKGPKAEAEGAEQAPAQEPTPTAAQQPEPKVPAQSSSDDEHELVSAAFDNIAVPKPATPADATEEPTATAPEPEPAATAQESEPEATPAPAAEQPKPATEPEPTPAPAATEQPEPATEEPTPEPEPAAAEQESESEPTPEPVAEEPTPAPEPEVVEPQSEPDPEPAPETVAEQPAPEPEPQVEAEAEAEPEADAPQAADGEEAPQGPPAPDDEARTGGAGGNDPAEGEAEAEQPTTEPVSEEPTPEPELEAEVEPEADTPQAADGEEAPQGPPAPDNETRTGGAGGNNPAEGEAEAEQPTTEPEPTAEAQPQPDAEENTAPAVPPTLTTAYHAAASALAKYDLTGTRATVYLVLDRSASMRPYYKDGSAQALGEQTLALAAHLDPEATVQVVFFSTEVDGTGELTLAEHENRVDDLHGSLGRMGRTSYHAAVDAVLAHRAESAGDPAAPVLVIFQTDGAPDAKTPATQSLTDAAKNHPAVFFSFVAFGEHENKAFDYLRKLKTDTAAFFHAGPTPRELTDQELYEGVLANWRP